MIAACILTLSMSAGIDPDLVHSIIKHESNYNSEAVGLVGEIGLMQIRPEYVPETAEQLKDPCTNIKRGIQMLKEAKESCKHKIDFTWVNCYNVGVAGGDRINHPKLFPYYKNIAAIYKERKNAVEQGRSP